MARAALLVACCPAGHVLPCWSRAALLVTCCPAGRVLPCWSRAALLVTLRERSRALPLLSSPLPSCPCLSPAPAALSPPLSPLARPSRPPLACTHGSTLRRAGRARRCTHPPPCWARKALYSFSSGYFSDPMKSMCSRKCASPATGRMGYYKSMCSRKCASPATGRMGYHKSMCSRKCASPAAAITQRNAPAWHAFWSYAG